MMKLIKRVFTSLQLETTIYTTFIIGSLIFLSLTSCSSTVEIIDDLCYNDRDMSHLCLKDEPESSMEVLEPLYKKCRELEGQDDIIWFECIMNESDRRELLERLV